MEKTGGRNAIVRNMIWSMLAVLVNSCIRLLVTPYITNNIGMEAYGYVSLATTFTSYIDIISVSLNAFAGRFISVAYHRGEWNQANRYYSSTILADLFLSAVTLIPGTILIACLNPLLKVPDSLLRDVQLLFALTLFKYIFTMIRTAFDASAFIANRLDLSEKKQSISYLLQAGILLIACTFLTPHVWYVGAAAAVAACYLLIANYRLCRCLTPELEYHRGYCSLEAVKEIVGTGLWTSLNNLGNVLNSGLDLLITNLMLSASALGEISVAKNLVLLCYTVTARICNAFHPKLLLYYAENKTEELVRLFQTAIRIMGILCCLLIWTFYVCGYDFLALWLPGQDTDFLFSAAMLVFLGDITPAAVKPLYYSYTLTKKVKVPCVITILMGSANVISMYLLIRFTQLGAYAVILTTLVLNLIHFIDAPLYSAYCLGISGTTFYPVILNHIFAMGMGFLAASYLRNILPFAESWGSLVQKGIISVTLLAIFFITISVLAEKIRKLLQNRRMT